MLQWDDKIHGMVEPFWIIVEDSDSGEGSGWDGRRHGLETDVDACG
jgi:hypothetical protein